MVSKRLANKRAVAETADDVLQQPALKKGRGKVTVSGKVPEVKTENVSKDDEQNGNDVSVPTTKKGRNAKGKSNKLIKDEHVDEDMDVAADEASTSNGITRKGRTSRAAALKAITDMKVKEQEDDDEEEDVKKPTQKKSIKNGTPKTSKSSKRKAGKAKSTKVNEIPAPPKKSGVERKLVKKGRAAVDSVCPIAASAHVLDEGDDIWDCMLNQTNIQFNNNKYYIIQLLEDDKGGVYSVWLRWGRVGANGQNNLVPFGSNLNQAKLIFSKKFSDKTRNEWDDRHDFEKVPGKYDLLHLDYSDDTKQEPDQVDGKKKKERKQMISKLEMTVKSLVELICDIKLMETMMVEMKYDAEKAPLGKLTTEQIKAGYLALLDISNLVDDSVSGGKLDNKALLQACNNFYTRVPHYFGMKVPPMIRTAADVREKLQLLEALGDIQAAMTFLNNDSLDDGLHPADRHYNGLQCDIKALDHDDETFKLISRYVTLNHGTTHTSYKLRLESVFECVKSAEKDRFETAVGNRMLLWHGSRLANWAGILRQGLRIAPPEAPVTGYMFGKGIYFADMCSKSANYCMASSNKTTGLLTLCEVALGTHNTLTNADYHADALPKGCQSVKGVGSVSPLPKNYVTMADGVIVPLGPATRDQKKNTSLIYNEYIVYKLAQVRLRYLVKVKFEFNTSW